MIPGLCPVEDAPQTDLQVWLGESPFSPDDMSDRAAAVPAGWETWFESPHRTATGEPMVTAVRVSDGGYYRITYSDGMSFVINRAATDVWVTWPSTLSSRHVLSCLLGVILGVVLRLRGVTCLHASAIEIDGRAVAFAGSSGSGKSTIAAAFAVQGVPVLADDSIALMENGQTWCAVPSYPRLKLWPEAACALAAEARGSANVPPRQDGMRRHHVDLTAGGYRFPDEPTPLGLVYLLEKAHGESTPGAGVVEPAQGLMALVRNAFATRVLDRDLRAREFEALSRFVTRVPIRRLTRPNDLARLAELRNLILDDLDSVGFARSTAAKY